MRTLILLSVLGASLVSLTPVQARERQHGRQVLPPGSSISGDRSYTTPGTVFHNDLHDWRGRPSDDCYSYGTPWWAVPGDPFANSFLPNVYSTSPYCYNQPRLSIGYGNGNWSAQLNTGCYGAPTGCWNPYSQAYPVRPRRAPHYDYRYAQPPVIYSAPASPAYGYGTGVYVGDEFGPQPGYVAQPPPQVYNDNRVYNYTFNNANQPAPAIAAVPKGKTKSNTKAKLAAADAQPQRPGLGQRFTDMARLATPSGDYLFVIRDGALYAGLETAKPMRISTACDAGFGGYAAWVPQAGVCVIYREGDKLIAAYPTKDSWWRGAAPYSVKFGRDTTIGLVGDQPWLVFSATSGDRYVVRFTGRAWEEVGSGTAR